MKSFASITEAVEAVDAFRFSPVFSQLPQQVQATIRTAAAAPSPVVKLVDTMEALYANRSSLDDNGLQLVASLSSFCAANGWHGLLEDNRGSLITQAALRDAGVRAPAGVRYQKPERDPEPLPQYKQAAEMEPVASDVDASS